ncbi:MAG: hypothetical protein ACXVAN_14495, partial [Polyangia bacterium]
SCSASSSVAVAYADPRARRRAQAVRAMQITLCVGRKVTLLASVLLLPGGLVLLVAVALAIVLMRTERGQRLLLPFKRRIPPRVRVQVKRVMAILTGEKIFLSRTTSVRST